MAISLNPTKAGKALEAEALRHEKGVETAKEVKASPNAKGVADTVKTDKMGFVGAALVALPPGGEMPAASENTMDVAGAYAKLAQTVTSGAGPADGAKASAQAEMPMSEARPRIGAALGFVAGAMNAASLTDHQKETVVNVVGLTNGLSTEEKLKKGIEIPPQLQAIIMAGLRGRGKEMIGNGDSAPPPPTGPAAGTMDPAGTATPTDPILAQTGAAPATTDRLTPGGDNQANQIASGKVVIPDANVLKMETLIQPIISGLSGMDIDGMVEMVLEQAGHSADEDLSAMVKDMQGKLKEKNAQRAKISALEKGQAALGSQITEKFFEMKADGALPAGMTEEQFKAQVKIAWGDGMTTPSGEHIGPTPTIVEPIVITDPSAVGSGNVGSGAAYGITDQQMSMLQDVYAHAPYAKPAYATFDAFVKDAVGLSATKKPQDMLTNLGAVATFVAGLAPGATQAPAAVDGPTSAAHLTQLEKDLMALAEVNALLAAGIVPTDSTQVQAALEARQTMLQQTVTTEMGQPGLLTQSDADKLAQWQTGTGSDTMFAQLQSAISSFTTIVQKAQDDYKAQVDKANNDIKNDGNDDNYVGIFRDTDSFGLTDTGYYGNFQFTGEGGDASQWEQASAKTGANGTGGADFQNFNVKMDDVSDQDNTNPLMGILTGVLAGTHPTEEIPIADPKAFATRLNAGAAGTVMTMSTQCALPQSAVNVDGPAPLLQADLDKYAGVQSALDSAQFAGITFNSDGTWSGDDSALDPSLRAALEHKFKETDTPAQAAAKAHAKANFDKTYGTGQTDDPAMQYTQTGSLAALGAALDEAKTGLDSMNEMSQMQSMRLQQAMDARQGLFSTLSNLIKKVSDTQDGIINNLK